MKSVFLLRKEFFALFSYSAIKGCFSFFVPLSFYGDLSEDLFWALSKNSFSSLALTRGRRTASRLKSMDFNRSPSAALPADRTYDVEQAA